MASRPRSQLALDPITAETVRCEPFTGKSLGGRLRAWVRPLHTGEAGGLAASPSPSRLRRAPPSSPGRGSPRPGAASAAGGTG